MRPLPATLRIALDASIHPVNDCPPLPPFQPSDPIPQPDPVPETAASPPPLPPAGPEPAASLRSLDPRVVPYWRIHSLMSAGIVLFVALIGGLVLVWNLPDTIPWVAAAWLALLAVRVWLFLWYPPRAFAAWAYRIDDKVLETRQGIWIRTVTLLPLPRLQHVDLHRGPLERAFGLASLTLFTAGTQHASITLPGLEASDASHLRDRLVAAGGDDAV